MPSLGDARGFTLLEMLIVVIVLGLVIAMASSRLNVRSGLDGAAEVLVSELRYTAQRAAATGDVHRFALDLPGQRFRTETRVLKPREETQLPGTPALLDLTPPEERGDFEPIATQQGNWRKLDETDVRIALVRVGDQETSDEVVHIGFAGGGGADPADVQLVDEAGFVQTIRVLGFTGEVLALEPTRD